MTAGQRDDTETIALADASAAAAVMLKRRSHRRFIEGTIPTGGFEYIRNCIDAGARTLGIKGATVLLETDPANAAALCKASTRGVIGRFGNPWMTRWPVQGFLTVCIDRSLSFDREGMSLALVEAGMLMEIAVLAAAEKEIATCWVAAIEMKGLGKVLELPPGHEVVSASPLGLPAAAPAGFNYDSVLRRLVSSKRKPVEFFHTVDEIAHE